MPKQSINLAPGARTPIPGAARAAGMAVPAPAKLPPGVRSGNPPLPIGKAVSTIDPRYLTDREKAARAQGWSPVDPQAVPAGQRAALQAAEEEARAAASSAPYRPPIDPSTPPLQWEVTDIGDLPPAQQAEAQRKINEALGESPAMSPGPPAAIPPTRPPPDVAQKVAAARQVDFDLGTPERPATRSVPDSNYTPPAPTAPPPPPAPGPSTGDVADDRDRGLSPLSHCPHCHWDLSRPGLPDPDLTEKHAFLAAVRLGDKPFTKTYTLAAGQLRLTFRTLTPREVDACFKHANKATDRGEVKTVADHWEVANRCRLYLQLSRLQTDRRDEDLPDGLDARSNPNAEAYWEVNEDQADEPLLAIEDYVLGKVLTTESLMRIAQQACGRFNQLVAKLEAIIDHPDFLKATEVPPSW